jgi:hypothetical protein
MVGRAKRPSTLQELGTQGYGTKIQALACQQCWLCLETAGSVLAFGVKCKNILYKSG